MPQQDTRSVPANVTNESDTDAADRRCIQLKLLQYVELGIQRNTPIMDHGNRLNNFQMNGKKEVLICYPLKTGVR
jgi:hypothetical protein